MSSFLDKKTVVELKQIATDRGIKGHTKLRKQELIELLQSTKTTVIKKESTSEKSPQIQSLIDPDLLKRKRSVNKYVQIVQLGKKGKEGTVYLVMDPETLDRYAMKKFRKLKSEKMLEKEVNFQFLAARAGIAPEVIEYNLTEKYIVMEVMSRTLMDVLAEQKGALSIPQQKQIIGLYTKLDSIGIMSNDANPLNIMEKNGRFYMIDYGFAKFTNHKNFNEYSNPNFQLMPLGLLLWMKGRYPTKGWTYIRSQINPISYEKMEVAKWE